MPTPRPSTWHALSVDLLERIALHLPHNDVVCNLRLVDKSTAEQLQGWTTVRLSQPVPQHALAHRWRMPAMTLEQRRLLVSLIASGGSLPNLEFAFAAADGSTHRLGFEASQAAQAAGHVHICEWLLAKGGFVPCMELAGQSGSSAMVNWAMQIEDSHHHGSGGSGRGAAGPAWKAFTGAARRGHRVLCQELLPRIPPDDQWWAVHRALRASAEAGHVDLVEWLYAALLRIPPPPFEDLTAREQLEGIYRNTWADAVYGMDLPALQQLHACEGLECIGPTRRVALLRGCRLPSALAALAGPSPDWREKLEWLAAAFGGPSAKDCVIWTRCSPPDRDVKDICWRPDAVERIRALQQYRWAGVFEDRRTLAHAVKAGHVAAVQYMLSEYGSGREDAKRELTAAAAREGHVAVLAELVAAGCPVGPEAARGAAWGGHLEVLRWMAGGAAGRAAAAALRAAERGKGLACCAARSGNLELVQWLWNRDVRWDARKVAVAAAEAGNVELLEWLVSWGCSAGVSCAKPYLAAARNGDYLTLRALRRLSCLWEHPTHGSAMFARAVADKPVHLEVLRWMVAEGCAVDWEGARAQVPARMAACRAVGQSSDGVAVHAWVEEMAARGRQGGGAAGGEGAQ